MALPSGYTELEYIESTGTQYIDTEFNPDSNTRVVANVYFDTKETAAWLFGSRYRNADRTFNFLTYKSAYRSDYNNEAGSLIGSSNGPEMVLDKNKNVVSINNVVVDSFSFSDFSSSLPIFLFANNNNGSVAGWCIARVYYLKIYDDGVLSRDFIPCKDTSGEIGMYDAVNGQFYGNAGSGAFIAGPEVILHPEKPSYVRNEMCVSLRWGLVDCEGYNLYKNGGLLTSTKYNSYVDYDVVDGEDITYSIKAYNSSYESDPIEITVSVREGYTVLLPVVNSAFFQ